MSGRGRPVWQSVVGVLAEVGAVTVYLLVLFGLCAVVSRW